MNIYVSNLSFNVTDEDLQDYFAEYGEVSSAKVIMDKFTGKSRGFAFVEMSDDEAAKKAIQELGGASVDGRTIGVSVAKPREDRGNGGGGNKGGGGFQARNNNYSNRRYYTGGLLAIEGFYKGPFFIWGNLCSLEILAQGQLDRCAHIERVDADTAAEFFR